LLLLLLEVESVPGKQARLCARVYKVATKYGGLETSWPRYGPDTGSDKTVLVRCISYGAFGRMPYQPGS